MLFYAALASSAAQPVVGNSSGLGGGANQPLTGTEQTRNIQRCPQPAFWFIFDWITAHCRPARKFAH